MMTLNGKRGRYKNITNCVDSRAKRCFSYDMRAFDATLNQIWHWASGDINEHRMTAGLRMRHTKPDKRGGGLQMGSRL